MIDLILIYITKLVSKISIILLIGSIELDFSALSPPNSIVSEELSNGGYSSPFQLSPMSSNQQQQQHVPSNQEKVIKTFK